MTSYFRVNIFLAVAVLFLLFLDSAAIISLKHTVYFNTNPHIPSKRGGGVIVTVIPRDP